MKKLIGIVAGGVVAFFLLLQLVPYGRNHTNPPVVKEPEWANPQARQIAKRACFDCHSNETAWPWYTNVAPFSWLTQRDVDEGRQVLNFSDWTGAVRRGGEGREGREGGEGGEGGGSRESAVEHINEVLAENRMPPAKYLIQHPQARLTEEEKRILVEGLQSSAASK